MLIKAPRLEKTNGSPVVEDSRFYSVETGGFRDFEVLEALSLFIKLRLVNSAE